MTSREKNRPKYHQIPNTESEPMESGETELQNDSSGPKASAEDLLLYDQLRKEILHRDTISLQTLGAVTVFVGALMGFAFSNQISSSPLLKVLLFFTAEIVAFTGQQLYLDRRRGMSLISSYIRVFIEEKTIDLKWETRISKFREISAGLNLKIRQGLQQWSYAGMQVINVILAARYLWQVQSHPVVSLSSWQFNVPEFTYLAFFALIHTPIIWRSINIPRLHAKYNNPRTFDNIWREVKRMESSSS